MNADYSSLKKMILEEILIGHTTQELSQAMGFKHDQYKRWLNEEKIFRWNDFELLCGKANINLRNALQLVVPSLTYAEEKRTTFSIVKEWSAIGSNGDVANYLNCHVSVIKRYNQGKTNPDFETMLKMLDLKKNQLANFIKDLFPYQVQNPELLEWMQGGIMIHMDILKYPLIPVVESALNLEHYKKRETSSVEWLSRTIKIELGQAEFLLNKMLDLGIITYDQSRDLYQSKRKVNNLEGLTFRDHIPSYELLNKTYANHLNKRKDPDYVSSQFMGAKTYIIFEMSEETMKKVNDIIFKAQNEIQQLAGNAPGPMIDVRGVSLESFSMLE